jgi:hypothetical protein
MESICENTAESTAVIIELLSVIEAWPSLSSATRAKILELLVVPPESGPSAGSLFLWLQLGGIHKMLSVMGEKIPLRAPDRRRTGGLTATGPARRSPTRHVQLPRTLSFAA